jgi:hypothetical protein
MPLLWPKADCKPLCIDPLYLRDRAETWWLYTLAAGMAQCANSATYPINRKFIITDAGLLCLAELLRLFFAASPSRMAHSITVRSYIVHHDQCKGH